ncbi:hypothetical protein J2S43_003657 [Catenuloplanes nepalensis]|uniref:Uncharacterized protein n=1 Tax=Catenuloplanes nepalensis TaxID=587533 RepID=A0ABT9MUP3_9ACTN|nr:hypothetical protein [Catenuloplanes nepalensis]MDP9795145.1 hypothetical protein [Catenuloplanes nepalensis]
MSDLDRLAAMFDRVDPVPEAVLAAARDAFGWRTIDADLARLTADSLLTEAAVRGDAARLLTFEAGGTVIEAEVAGTGTALRVLGQVVPPGPARVRLEQPGGTAETVADALGRFTLTGVRPGPSRFVCTRLPSGPAVRTEWTVL